MDINNNNNNVVSDKFQIIPSTGSMIMEMMIVIILFLGYIIYVSYLSAYKTGFKPNYVMFLDMLFDRNDDQRFQTYIKSIGDDKNITKEENFETKNNKNINSNSNTFFDNVQFHFYKFISTFYVTGNQIRISKKERRI